MSIKIVVAPKVKFKVKGTFADENGKDVPFDFSLTAKRLDMDQIAEQTAQVAERTNSARDFLVGVIEDWSGVNDADGQAIPFSTDALDSLLKLPGVVLLVFRAFLDNNGAKEKN